jgi:molecular chaperone HscC
MILGVDLGTTNCACAIWRDGVAQLIPNSLGHTLTPSAVSVGEGDELIIGLPARERQTTHPDRTATVFKRYMGSTRKTSLGRQAFLPEELSALLLASLKRDAEAFLGEPVTEAVITVPAYFNDKQRKATRRAGQLAGLKVERLINEPTAAALAYGLHEREKESRFLVFDLGGGTFDVSVLEIFEGVIEVRSSTGDNRLGGEDFNDLLVERMRLANAAAWGSATRSDEGLHQRLRASAERARRALTSAPQAAATMSVVWKDRTYTLDFGAEDLEQWAEPLLARLREPVVRALRDGGLRADALDEVVLIGGATRMPLVRRVVTKMFGRFPATGVNPDEAVAIGAAIQAGLKARDAALNEVVFTDVCPYTLGVDNAEELGNGQYREGVFSPIIERNTTIPASRMRTYYPLSARQTALQFNIYQGESRMVADNVALGSVIVPIPAGDPAQMPVECRFTYDINGLLEVDVHVPRTGERRQAVILDDESLSPDELHKRREALARLKIHPRDLDANKAVLARAERCFEGQTGDQRAYVGQLITRFEAVLERQDPRACEPARAELSAELDRIDGQVFL